MPVIEVPGKGNVEFPDSMPPQDILAAIKTLTPQAPAQLSSALPKGPGGFPIVPPGTPVGTMPSPLQVMGKGLTQNWPDILAGAATLGIGGPTGSALAKPLVGPLARTMVGGGVKAGAQAAQNVLQGTDQSPLAEGAKFAGGQALGEGVLGGIKYAANPLLKQRFVADTMKKLGAYLHEKAPVLSKYPATEAGVRTMFYTQRGVNTMHEMYDKSLKEVVERGINKEITIPASAAEVLGITPSQPNFSASLSPSVRAALVKAGKLPAASGPGLQTGVVVNAADAAQKITGQWSKYPGEYAAVAQALDAANIGDPVARAGYKAWAGLRKYFDLTGSFKNRQFQPEKAAAGFDKLKPLDQLIRRQIGDEAAAILSPGRFPIEKKTLSLPGTLAGGVAGSLTGGTAYPGIGHLGGAAGGSYLGHRVGQLIPHYTNIPTSPGMNFLQRLGATGTGIAARGALAPPTQETSTDAQ